MNALIAKAVEICHESGKRYLLYGKFTYGNKRDTTIAEFKREWALSKWTFRDTMCRSQPMVDSRCGEVIWGPLGLLPASLLAAMIKVRSRWLLGA